MCQESMVEGLILSSSGLVKINECRRKERAFQGRTAGANGAVESKARMLGRQPTGMRKHDVSASLSVSTRRSHYFEQKI